MTELERLVHERIRKSGPLPFAAFMQLALYDPRAGYYAGGGRRSGWGGHFLTSPELDPAYGLLWGRAFEGVWEECGRPNEFAVIEVGPGEGGFAEAVLMSAEGRFAEALRYTLVERIPAVEERQRARLAGRAANWARSTAEVPIAPHGVVFANEILDNLPVHVVERRSGDLMEVCVDSDDEHLVESLRPPAGPELARWLEWAEVALPDGHRFEVTMAAQSFIAHCAAAFEIGALVLVDYGAESGELAARPGGTLVTYSERGAGGDPLERPGRQDITAHANWTVVRKACADNGLEPRGPALQRHVLRALGAGALDAELREEHANALSESRGVDALRALSRRGALGALLDEGGLGGLGVMTGTRGVPPDALLG